MSYPRLQRGGLGTLEYIRQVIFAINFLERGFIGLWERREMLKSRLAVLRWLGCVYVFLEERYLARPRAIRCALGEVDFQRTLESLISRFRSSWFRDMPTLVQVPVFRGTLISLSASTSELFPADWSPTTTIFGNCLTRSSTPSPRRLLKVSKSVLMPRPRSSRPGALSSCEEDVCTMAAITR